MIKVGYAANASCLELDFGDGSETLKSCQNNTDAHTPTCLTLVGLSDSSCSTHHACRSSYNFTVRVAATNGFPRLEREASLILSPNPIVQIAGMNVFNIYLIDRFPSFEGVRVYNFGDDTKIYAIDENGKRVLDLLERDAKLLVILFHDNSLTLNEENG